MSIKKQFHAVSGHNKMGANRPKKVKKLEYTVITNREDWQPCSKVPVIFFQNLKRKI